MDLILKAGTDMSNKKSTEMSTEQGSHSFKTQLTGELQNFFWCKKVLLGKI